MKRRQKYMFRYKILSLSEVIIPSIFVIHKTPENVIIEELENNKIKVKWDQVNFAEEYAIYFIDTEGEKSQL